MTEALRWKVKRDRDNREIPRCWITDSGYTVAECRTPAPRFTVARPGDSWPFAYCGERTEVEAVILADMQATPPLTKVD
jgi:hypothetical protein